MAVALTVVVPVKDEAQNVGILAREIATALAGDTSYEVIFVDDASTDGTPTVLKQLKEDMPQLRIIRHARNAGQSRALRTGVSAARSEIVATLDGDGQNDPADLPKLLAEIQAGGFQLGMVAGVRLQRRDNWAKRQASRAANRVRNWALKDGATDTGCGLKAFRRSAYLALPYFDHMHRYLITLMLREGYKVQYVNVSHRPRLHGRSKYGVWDRAIVGITDLLGVRWLQHRFRGGVFETEEL
ncbi:MAG: glycosyltransferase family 2 protein [Alphaproteobacteria bacterium]|nr:glycosyltransferase family 2 protein [Alphaproteobacteria bacterium]